ncbi:hypothetical protein EPA93_08970 [Ktedonosporobacter rubrisoli]|uniref:SRPBCC family protein n=1 Tax=Ktedonosporobacter rubrisoli TaxID=2509675 RepID=A0A4P6JM13_KTERU|nr:hypothetical protein [Ktedonosporobacter rubrisoli]QBD76133.1 hypothetical protein EPA93_08970 [Ktedonosporobacter rubrisoli]
MLLDTYLPAYHFHEVNTLMINGEAKQIYTAIKELDFTRSKVLTALFTMGGLVRVPHTRLTLQGFLHNGFSLLEERPGDEMVIGTLWRAPLPPLRIERPPRMSAEAFLQFHEPGYAKLAWNFSLHPSGKKQAIVRTETRVYCLDPKTKRQFSCYWLLVGPASYATRCIMLQLVREALLQDKAETSR